ncbi:MAG: YhbY family RNA-binding protein [Spirochaetes bacterium]|nr:YhbY family RNA-binding protein [Spirochaetota bacterium]
MNLSKEIIKKLRLEAEKIKPNVLVGKNGLSESIIKKIDMELSAHELIKIKIHDSDIVSLKEKAPKISSKTGSVIIRLIGKTLVLYRKNPEKEK